jgi:hypothetical protein
MELVNYWKFPFY